MFWNRLNSIANWMLALSLVMLTLTIGFIAVYLGCICPATRCMYLDPASGQKAIATSMNPQEPINYIPSASERQVRFAGINLTHEDDNVIVDYSHTAPKRYSYQPSSIYLDGKTPIPYVASYFSESAPAHGAGVFAGASSTTDGKYGYFIGHNPGDFSHLMNLGVGDQVTVCDADGNVRTYTIYECKDVSRDTLWAENEEKTMVDLVSWLEGQEFSHVHIDEYTETIALQTCNGNYYRVCVAA